ncbi:MAG: hypothetical protein H0V25_09660, partial [Solirubrobacterales bacterium]|nr:hypothetical protein [Solirubrobacterales bacterium]
LLSCYPDATLNRNAGAPAEIERVIRLKKRLPFIQALRALTDEEPNMIDSLLNQMVSLEQDSIAQYSFVPTPAFFDRVSRWRYAAEERSIESRRGINPNNPGLKSQVSHAELEGGLRVQNRPLFFTDIRVGAATYQGARAIAGSVRGVSAGENRLVERYMRPSFRGPLYVKRIKRGIANPFPSFRKGVLSSVELAGLWHLPSPGLKRVRIARSPVPRMPATPEISRAPEHVLMRDERGGVGIRPEDKSDGLGLIGGQKTGKTSVLCRTVQADGIDEDCAMIVLMPKPGDAMKALSMVPKNRTVHFLDLENPEFGINPLMGDGNAASVADKIVDAFRDVGEEGDIKGSSDRYLRQAAQAAIGGSRAGVIEGPPTLWHMYRMLIPIEVEFRRRVVESLYADPSYTDTATFFGRELPNDLENTGGQTNAKLDAPRNKILRLLVESLDKVLRHPNQLSIDDVVANREVLVVDGKMGTFGADNTRVMMQFILTALYAALRRQQEMAEDERVRVALKVDEAHLILNESFADAMATLRSGGLEVVAAWQYGEQIQDPKIRSGMMSLLRQRCMFSMGEEADAREMSSIAMAVFADMIRSDPESRKRMRVTPDMIFNMPNFHAINSWISRGARAPAFLGQTIPLELDEDVVKHHLDAQKARGGFIPDRLPDPLPDLDYTGVGTMPSSDVPPPDAGTPAPAPSVNSPLGTPVGAESGNG